jgi:hypothetical protein
VEEQAKQKLEVTVLPDKMRKSGIYYDASCRGKVEEN